MDKNIFLWDIRIKATAPPE
jgi:WD40 repeat protein